MPWRRDPPPARSQRPPPGGRCRVRGSGVTPPRDTGRRRCSTGRPQANPPRNRGCSPTCSQGRRRRVGTRMTIAEDPRPAASPRVPPHDLDAETSLLGRHAAVPATPSPWPPSSSAPRTSTRPAHAHVFDAISSLTAAGEPGRSGHRGRRAAAGPACSTPSGAPPCSSSCRPPPRPRPTPPTTPRSSRSCRCCAGSSGSRATSPRRPTGCPTTSPRPSTGPSPRSSTWPSAR